jgi:cysteinyl-tRNA synthetase
LDFITPTLRIHITEPVGVSDAVPEVEIAPPAQFTEVQTRLTAEQQEKIRLWEKMRAEKNYPLADKIRKDLKEQGVLLESTKEGFRVRILPPKKQKE